MSVLIEPLQLFTRLPVDDSAESGISSFMVEMRDIAYMLQNVTDSSLIIMDEMGRGMDNRILMVNVCIN